MLHYGRKARVNSGTGQLALDDNGHIIKMQHPGLFFGLIYDFSTG